MAGGIALLAVVTGSVATWFVESMRYVEEEVEQSSNEIAEAPRELIGEIRTLAARVEALEAQRDDNPS
jgi:voltage-gated potassium channel